MNRRAFLAQGVALAASPAEAAPRSYSGEHPDMLLSHLGDKLNRLAEKWDGERARLLTPADIERRNVFVREKFREMLGPFPERCLLEPVVQTRRYIDLYRKYRQLCTGTKDAVEVPLLRSVPSITFNHARAQLSAILTDQALIQAQIPFVLIFDEHLEDLSKHKALILPEAECLSDAQIAKIHSFVERGGGPVALGQTGLYDEWRRLRVKPGLPD